MEGFTTLKESFEKLYLQVENNIRANKGNFSASLQQFRTSKLQLIRGDSY